MRENWRSSGIFEDSAIGFNRFWCRWTKMEIFSWMKEICSLLGWWRGRTRDSRWFRVWSERSSFLVLTMSVVDPSPLLHRQRRRGIQLLTFGEWSELSRKQNFVLLTRKLGQLADEVTMRFCLLSRRGMLRVFTRIHNWRMEAFTTETYTTSTAATWMNSRVVYEQAFRNYLIKCNRISR